jgi:hypothetical protein
MEELLCSRRSQPDFVHESVCLEESPGMNPTWGYRSISRIRSEAVASSRMLASMTRRERCREEARTSLSASKTTAQVDVDRPCGASGEIHQALIGGCDGVRTSVQQHKNLGRRPWERQRVRSDQTGLGRAASRNVEYERSARGSGAILALRRVAQAAFLIHRRKIPDLPQVHQSSSVQPPGANSP